ncbi:MAG: hypothetical protein NWF06_03740 [Candidatus Bathyarchaeota archaeon]|nr:hypothetical protein [Candidatus Bathyarchaeum sp.]
MHRKDRVKSSEALRLIFRTLFSEPSPEVSYRNLWKIPQNEFGRAK